MAGKKGALSLKAVDIQPRYEETFMESLDGRSIIARELRDNFRELVSDLGGLAELSYLERSIVKRLIHLERQVKKTEEVQARDGKVDDYLLLYQIRTLRELSNALGLKRRSKVIGTYDEYVNGKAVGVSTPTKGRA